MPIFCVTSRHSPLVRKRLIVSAKNADEAVDLFLEENRQALRGLGDRGVIIKGFMDKWEQQGGVETLDVEEAAPGSLVDVPVRQTTPARPAAKQPPSVGRVGRRPGVPEVKPPADKLPRRRQTLAERAFEIERAHATQQERADLALDETEAEA